LVFEKGEKNIESKIQKLCIEGKRDFESKFQPLKKLSYFLNHKEKNRAYKTPMHENNRLKLPQISK